MGRDSFDKTVVPIAPLSVNKAWQGRRFKTKEYDSWLVKGLYLLKSGEKQKNKPYKINIEFYISSLMDIDNPVKMFLDLLVKAGIIEDDRYIEELNIKKIKSKEKKIVFYFS